MSEFLAESPQPTASEGLSKGPYMVARAGSEPITLTKGDESTNEPPRPEVCSRQVYWIEITTKEQTVIHAGQNIIIN